MLKTSLLCYVGYILYSVRLGIEPGTSGSVTGGMNHLTTEAIKIVTPAPDFGSKFEVPPAILEV